MSARPFLVPCVEMKYSSTFRPSLKLDLMGTLIVRPDGSATRPLMPASCPSCPRFPLAPEVAIMYIGLNLSRLASMAFWTFSLASVQMSCSFCSFSVSVRRPLLNWRSTFSISMSAWPSICFFSGGMAASMMPTVVPE